MKLFWGFFAGRLADCKDIRHPADPDTLESEPQISEKQQEHRLDGKLGTVRPFRSEGYCLTPKN